MSHSIVLMATKKLKVRNQSAKDLPLKDVKLRLQKPSIKKKGRLRLKEPSHASEESTKVAQDQSKCFDQDHKCLSYSLSSSLNCGRHLFLKADASNPRSLLVGNIPFYLDLAIVRGFLSQFVKTPIEEIVAVRSNAGSERLDAGQLTASLLFSSEEGVQQALSKAEAVGPYVASEFGEVTCKSSLQAQCERYERMVVPAEELQARIDAFIQEHDKTNEEQKRWRKRKQEPDEEGWITVHKGSRKPVPDAKKARKGDVAPTGKKVKRKIGEDVAFYTFQVKDSKLKHLSELRAKFEEDKKRVALAKAARKFKPI